MGNSLHRDPVGELGGGFIFQTPGDTVIFGLLFLDPEDVRSTGTKRASTQLLL